jgi:glutamyl-Q tRNA(Asp) synthetase
MPAALVAALASWLDARAQLGRWLVRIEDVDTPRCLPGAGEVILGSWPRWACGPTRRRCGNPPAARPTRRRWTSWCAGLAYPCAAARARSTPPAAAGPARTTALPNASTPAPAAMACTASPPAAHPEKCGTRNTDQAA